MDTPFKIGDIVTPAKTNEYLELLRNRPKIYPPEGTIGKVLGIDRRADKTIPTVAMVDWGEFGVLFVKIKLLRLALL